MQDRREAKLKLEKAISENKVDNEILELLKIINSSRQFYTTSSCSGRIILIELEEIGDKVGAKILGKWHIEVKIEGVLKALSMNNGIGTVYLMVQSPIFHVVCSDINRAEELFKLAVNTSFKYSSIKSIEKKGKVIVEILSSEQINIPVALNGKIFPSNEYLEYLVGESNATLKRAKKKLVRLKENIKDYLSNQTLINENHISPRKCNHG